MLLLIVLALLALFGLVAVTFVVVTSQARRSARSVERVEQVLDPPQKLLQQAMMQVLRGSNSNASVMAAHGLLEDMYGNNWVAGQILSNSGSPHAGPVFIDPNNQATWPTGGQLVWITPDATNMPTLSDQMRRIGCVLTMIDGPAIGQSVRIVGYDYDPNRAVGERLRFHLDHFDGQSIRAADAHILVNGNELSGHYVVNGVPFSGTGFGYDATGAAQSRTVGGVSCPLALLPNHADNRTPAGGANSDYTAADFQHMLMAAQVYNTVSGSVQTLPSMHRPALVRYWMQTGGNALTAEQFRNITMRPIGPITSTASTAPTLDGTADHPDFTGSNPNFNPAWDGKTAGQGQWDVDNDGDGVPDSVWVDLGMPARATSDGRLYKPLFAILCVDLDGRLNVNAQGCLAQTGTPTLTPTNNPNYAGGGSVTFPRGQGYGPAEISLQPALGTTYGKLLNWRYPDLTSGGWLGGEAGHRLSLNKWFLYGAGNYSNFSASVDNSGAFGSPPDLLGCGAIGLDWGGRPIYADMGQVYDASSNAVKCPYEFDLSANRQRGASDTPGNLPFSVAELERILRPFDRDATLLPSRLALASSTSASPADSVLLPTTAAGQPRRLEVTTESWDVPSPSTALSADILRAGLSPAAATALMNDLILNNIFPTRHPADVFKALLMKKGLTSVQADASLPSLIAPELLAGRKLDLSRAFGNGHDNAGHGVVDESEPPEAGETVSLYSSTTGAAITPNLNYDPRGTSTNGTAANSLQARELYARYLYVLVMLLADTDALTTQVTQLRATRGQTTTADDVARFVAQWAVNVVDFYDRDSIMTRFRYDPTPFTSDGWRVRLKPSDTPPGNELTAPPVVWGCERPELLITETLALHDRRTQDLNTEGAPFETGHTRAGTTTDSDPSAKDPSFDQQKKPQGSLFIELYNPWSDQEPFPRELGNTAGTGIVLSKTVPGTSCPVWRMIIVPGNPGGTPPADPDDDTSPPVPLRSIYFADPTSTPSLTGDGTERFYTTTASPAILPHQYALIGSAEPGSDADAKTTYIGRMASVSATTSTDPNDSTQTRQIRLDMGTGTPVRNNLTTGSPDVQDSELQSTVRIPISTPRRLNISEPDGGYTNSGFFDTGSMAYSPPLDRPLDYDRTDAMAAAVKTHGTTPNVAIVCLQRLANPLATFDPTTNPYRTIDSMPIDLVAFNGWADDSSEVTRGNLTSGTIMFASHQRGEPTNATKTPAQNALWTERLGQKTLTTTCQESAVVTPPVPQSHVFPYVLHHTLGFMNRSLAFPDSSSTQVLGRVTSGTYRGDPDGSLFGDGSPKSPPFPWLTWNNRPFVSQLELLFVPWAKSSQLSWFFAVSPSAPSPYANFGEPFPHMMNPFQSGASTVAGAAGTVQFHRILEYVGVPSRFVGTEVQIRPDLAANPADVHDFHTPFNRIPTYREPGKLNLNTIYSQEVFQGLMANYPDLATDSAWKKFVASRQGAAAETNNVLGVAGGMPTEFAHPFRSFNGWSMTPTTPAGLRPAKEIDCTLLRSDLTGNQPLFQASPPPSKGYNDARRNPYFRYQGLERLGNLVTTRSNVYAVWITVGYFEVTPALTVDTTRWPDGYQLGRELGTDTGEIERHRAFYIIDRTIPVGFQRGQDLNAEKAVLINRFIE